MRRKKMNSNLSKRFRVLAMSLALIGTMLVGPMSNTTEASARGCTDAPGGEVCIDVKGKGLHVESVRAERKRIRFSMDPLTWYEDNKICNYSAKVVFRYPSGRKEELQTKRSKNGACSKFAAWFDWKVDRKFPDGTRVFVYFYEDGRQQGGAPAQTIKEKNLVSRVLSRLPKPW